MTNGEPAQRPGEGRRAHAFTDDALGDSDTVDLVARLRAGDVSPAELVAAAVARARAVEPTLNAVVSWVPDPALNARHSAGPLAGIPTFVKDNENLAGLPTRSGSRATSDRPAASSSVWVRQFLQLGTVPLGKSTLPEFGLTCTTESRLSGATRNPWHLDRSTGGSSGGSAALVAAGAVPIAHANDGGGSIRLPASCCGLVGMKPSRHRIIDARDYDRLPVNLVTQGVVTRSVRDTALYLAEAERRHRDPSLEPVGHVTRPTPERLRVGVMLEGHSGRPPAPTTEAIVRSVADLLDSLGHRVTETGPLWDRQVAVDFLRYWGLLAYGLKRWGGSLFGEPFRPELTEPFTDELARFLRLTAERLPSSLRRLRLFARRYDSVFADYDVLLSPVLADEPPEIGYLGPDVDPRVHLIRLVRLMSVTPLHNVAGAPAVSLPMGHSAAGVPIGVHVCAPVGKEARLLGLALELEEARPFARIQDEPD